VALATLLAAAYACSVADLTSGSSDSDAADAPSGSFQVEAGGDHRVDAVPQDGAMGESVTGNPDVAAGADVALDVSSWAAPSGPVLLQNALNQQYLDVADASVSDLAQAVTASLTALKDQYWTFKAESDTSYEIINQASNKCLDDMYGLTAAGTSLIQYACNDNDTNQRWYLVNNQGNLIIVGQPSGRCLASQSLSNPDVVIIEDCSVTSAAQQWHIPH
jgi:hypothetical protein